ncbi:hypothetical protein ATCC90586_001676 [Pythium insidiosum]|nr:hypothetical protein ATCC90586_001676 [Pythium insidiosum]
MDRLGAALAIDATSSAAPTTKPLGAARRPAAAPPTDKSANRMSLAETLAVPWSLTLEKELAMVCAEMAASLVAGDPMLRVEFAGVESQSCEPLPSVLFRGGLQSDVVRSSVIKTQSLDRTVTHAPVDGGNPDHLFSLVLPPPVISAVADASSGETTDIEFSVASVERFLRAMAGCSKRSSDVVDGPALALCDWLRDQFVKKDASYRLLVRQGQQKPGLPGGQTMGQETGVENAFFAALLHLEGLGLAALRFAASLGPSKTSRVPPRSLLQLWRSVAELRRRVVNRRMTIKNLEPSATVSSSQQIADFTSRIVERCQLLLLLANDEHEEHAAYELDGGFVSPWNPAASYRSTALTAFPKGGVGSHIASRYGDSSVPFLAAFPQSRWRRVRTLFHVTLRWKHAARHDVKATRIADAALEFATRPDRGRRHDLQTVFVNLVEPLRRLACAARGYELLCDLLALPSLAWVQLSVVRQVTDVFVTQGTPTDNPLASLFFRELARGARHEYLTFATSLMATTARAALQQTSDAGVSVSATKSWTLLGLLRPWSQPLDPDDLEMVCDIGIVPMLLTLAEKLSARVASCPPPSALVQGDSIRSMALVASKAPSQSSAAGDEAKARHVHVMHALVRLLSLHFAFQHGAPGKTTHVVPTFPVAARVFDALLDESSRLARRMAAHSWLPPELSADQQPAVAGASAPLRRSFELVIAPTVFSPFRRGIMCRYADMVDPPARASIPRQPMAPLVKPGEFTVTMWLFVDALSTDQADLDDRRVVFVRGSDRELNPFFLLSRDVDGNWHFEVGVAFAAGRSWVERLASKDSVRVGVWTHVAVALEGAKMRLYLNGVLDTQRTLAAPLVAACAASAVSLDFHFGRISSEESAVGRLLSTLAARPEGERRTSPSASPVRSFRGLLSHFRFHNRALSPIHVRIVFDEKKPVDEDAVVRARAFGPSLSGDAERFLQLHAVMHVLSSSAEGLLQMSQPKWIAHLWSVAQTHAFPSLQRASLRLLGRLLPFLAPSAVAHALSGQELLAALEAVDAPHRFALVLLRTIGACLSIKFSSDSNHDEDVSIVRGESLELRVSTAMRLLDDRRRRTDRTALAIELAALVVHLCVATTAEWREAICQVVGLAARSTWTDDDALGAWFIASGSTELLFEGAHVELALTRERGVVIAMEEPTRRADPTMATSQRVFVCLNASADEDEARDFDWRASLLRECALLRAHFLNASLPSSASTPRQFIKLCAQDLDPVAPPSLLSHEVARGPLLASLVSAAAPLLQDVAQASTPPVSDDGATSACEELGRLQRLGLILTSLAEVAKTKNGARLLLSSGGTVESLMRLATRDDSLSTFHTLHDVEKKLWAARSRLHQLVGDLGAAGEEALCDWARQNRAAHRRAEDGLGRAETKRNALDTGPEAMEETRQSLSSRIPPLDLDLHRDDEEPASSRTATGIVDDVVSARHRQSDAGNGGRIPFSTSFGADNGRSDGGEDDDAEDDEEDDEEDGEDDEEDEEDDDDDDDGDDHRQQYVDELMIMGFPEDWCVMALKQTENDIVAASAWIVDNLEYLSRMQISLDKQRDQTSDILACEDEEDDVDDAAEAEGASDDPSSFMEPALERVSRAVSPETRLEAFKSSPSSGFSLSRHEATAALVNDKEMARKVFGEMYFPFDEGGHLSNTKEAFLKKWQVRDSGNDATTKVAEGGSAASPETASTAPSFDRFQAEVETWELEELLNVVDQFEHAFATLSARVVLVRLLENVADLEMSAELLGRAIQPALV